MKRDLCLAGSFRKPCHIKCNGNALSGAPQSPTHLKILHVFTAGVHTWVYGHSYTELPNTSPCPRQELCHSAAQPTCLNTLLQLLANSSTVNEATQDLGLFKRRVQRCLCTLLPTNIFKAIPLPFSFKTLLLVMTENTGDWTPILLIGVTPSLHFDLLHLLLLFFTQTACDRDHLWAGLTQAKCNVATSLG